MPTFESIVMRLHGANWFSVIDLKNAFFHIVLDERSRHLTNFFSGEGMYRCCRLPFGLTNAPDIFQEALQSIVLANCKGTVNYLDDVLVYGETKAEHDANLQEVLKVKLNTFPLKFSRASPNSNFTNTDSRAEEGALKPLKQRSV